MVATHTGKLALLMKRLHQEVTKVKSEHFALKIDNAFVLWFMEAYLIGDRQKAFDTVVGGKGDKTVDAVYVDERNHIIHLVQGKYHQVDANDNADLLGFAQRARDFWNAEFAEELKHAGPGAKKQLLDAHKILHRAGKSDFRLKMYFATTGKVSAECQKKAKLIAAGAGNTNLEVLAKPAILGLFANWLEGQALPVPEMEIDVSGPHTLTHVDGGLQGWIFTTTSQEICRLYQEAGPQIFARNVRGHLGEDKSINKEIGSTAKKQPQLFWFLNNGITIVADKAEKRETGKRRWMMMQNPQIVNGQQTVRALEAAGSNPSKVLVRLIRLDHGDAMKGIVGLVGEVVRATNRQNAIKQADLMANDAEQVRIERDFRKLEYAYERKRQSPKEFSEKAFKHAKVKREDLANALSATELGPHTVRRQDLWEKRYSKLFSEKRQITDYLARWWVSRLVVRVPGAVPIEAHWVVLACLWKWQRAALSACLHTESRRKALIDACQDEDGRILAPLRIAAKQLFIAAKSVFIKEKAEEARRAKRSKKPFKVLTPDTFFRREGVLQKLIQTSRRDKKREAKITLALSTLQDRLG